MNKDETLKFALDVLKNTASWNASQQYTREQKAIKAIEAALEAKDEPVAYVPYGVFDAWLDQAWLGVRCLNPQLCDPDKVDVQPIYAYPNSLRQPLTDEEIERIYNRYGGEMINCARAIERAHGIKGEA